MTNTDPDSPRQPVEQTRRPIERLLFVADAAVAEADDLPPAVRVLIDAAAQIFVLTPTLPGRLAWLADDVDGFRHRADERLHTVLGHVRSMGGQATGHSARGRVTLVIEDAVAEFHPDHVLIAVCGPDHTNWQERGLIDHVEARTGLPVTVYAVDNQGHAVHR
jgi:hypothetical protein